MQKRKNTRENITVEYETKWAVWLKSSLFQMQSQWTAESWNLFIRRLRISLTTQHSLTRTCSFSLFRRELSRSHLKTPQWPYYWWCRCALAQVSDSISFQFKVLNWWLLQKEPMDCNVICIKRANIRGRDAASNEVRACRQRLFCCELVASFHLSPPQSRHCDRARCLKIPCEGLCLLYGFVLVCGDTECLHTVGLAQGSFISWINDSFFVDLHHKAKW